MADVEKDKVNIRPMERRDIFTALALFKKISEGRSPLTYRDLINSDLGGALDLSSVAELDEKIVGFILARLAYVGVPVTEVGIIQSLVVDPNYRRQHIGARLIDAISHRCYDEGVNELRAFIHERDWELETFFENLGFHCSKLVTYTKTFEG